ncbi:MAG: LuxR family transcriptional regulator [Planktotalea sp.]|uniref:helix-turn-helix transcriptional regulator n=1 Tax=Planktotalea sp. TaxID=2029877 RepID=UPI003C77D73C
MDLIDLGASDHSGAEFTEYLGALCDQLELDYASYCAINTVSDAVQGFATYPVEWIEHYMGNGLQNLDPTIAVSARSIAPVDWSRLQRFDGFNAVFANGRDFGISDRGLTVPIRGPYGECGLLSVTRDTSEREWALLKGNILTTLQTAAVNMHDAVMQSDKLSIALRRPVLSQRECEVLQWIAAGKSQQDIGDILSISFRTVEVHLRSARSKLSALTTAQAVGRGISLGFIHPK